MSRRDGEVDCRAVALVRAAAKGRGGGVFLLGYLVLALVLLRWCWLRSGGWGIAFFFLVQPRLVNNRKTDYLNSTQGMNINCMGNSDALDGKRTRASNSNGQTKQEQMCSGALYKFKGREKCQQHQHQLRQPLHRLSPSGPGYLATCPRRSLSMTLVLFGTRLHGTGESLFAGEPLIFSTDMQYLISICYGSCYSITSGVPEH